MRPPAEPRDGSAFLVDGDKRLAACPLHHCVSNRVGEGARLVERACVARKQDDAAGTERSEFVERRLRRVGPGKADAQDAACEPLELRRRDGPVLRLRDGLVLRPSGDG